jgi:hypothetical protein
MCEDVTAPRVADEEGDRAEHVVEIVDERKRDSLEIRGFIGPYAAGYGAQRPIVIDGSRFRREDGGADWCTKIDAAMIMTKISWFGVERASLLEGGGYLVSCIDWPCHRLI